ncbi:hypothetical protein SNOG_09356 [Parastagonospora nodorum SN15]|uniref:Uncharacterized protein n=1 Tax=Phaeosphaeria nodorum (strain SN15 / ATCC MYA-4574 / FGSC 10173) TaxID=321614 RepID=Q0UFV8_PHANO|nr:hypothetical protein SNOG_09356 [Parastagonospora nodorum SN15]EAT83548.1 hypothetical protein SNOG_09356 [Parastagonospora nodorum SN15]
MSWFCGQNWCTSAISYLPQFQVMRHAHQMRISERWGNHAI